MTTVLLADEPTGNLIADHVSNHGTFQELHDQGKTIILVTHELDIAEYAKAKIVLKDGDSLSEDPIVNRILYWPSLSWVSRMSGVTRRARS